MMLNQIINIKNNNKIEEQSFLHILSIILRAWNEIEYMKIRDKKLDTFILNQMEDFSIKKDFEKIYIYYKKEELVYSITELKILAKEIYSYLEENYPIGYKYEDIDPIYMSLFLYEFIPRIKKIEFDDCYINDFKLLRRNSEPVGLELSESYKALKKGEECSVYTPFKSNHLIDSDYDRLMGSLDSVKVNGYPYKNQFIVLYNDEFYIRDGQHRASVLKYLYGNIKVPVMRIYIEGDLNDD